MLGKHLCALNVDFSSPVQFLHPGLRPTVNNTFNFSVYRIMSTSATTLVVSSLMYLLVTHSFEEYVTSGCVVSVSGCACVYVRACVRACWQMRLCRGAALPQVVAEPVYTMAVYCYATSNTLTSAVESLCPLCIKVFLGILQLELASANIFKALSSLLMEELLLSLSVFLNTSRPLCCLYVPYSAYGCFRGVAASSARNGEGPHLPQVAFPIRVLLLFTRA